MMTAVPEFNKITFTPFSFKSGKTLTSTIHTFTTRITLLIPLAI